MSLTKLLTKNRRINVSGCQCSITTRVLDTSKRDARITCSRGQFCIVGPRMPFKGTGFSLTIPLLSAHFCMAEGRKATLVYSGLFVIFMDAARDPQGRLSLLMSNFQLVVSDVSLRDCRNINPFLLHRLCTRAVCVFSIVTNQVSSHAEKKIQS